MRQRIRATVVVAVISISTMYAIAQSTPAIHGGGNEPPLRPIEVLQAKGIDSSHESLAAALHNSEKLIRIEAATLLAINNDPEAKSLIESALASESNPKAVVALASVLMLLEDPAGASRLTEICTDRGLPDELVADAAFNLLERGLGAQCIDELVTRLRDPNRVDKAMYLIPSLGLLYVRASQTQQPEIVEVLKTHLSDKNAWTRMYASRALVQAASPDSAKIIKVSLQREANLMVRAAMESDLTTLPKKK